MKEITLTYSRAQQMLNNWNVLDGLRNDEAIKAFHINCAIEDTFKPLEKNERKLDKERQQIIQDIQEEVNSRQKADDESVKETKVRQLPNGSVSMENLPEDIEDKYRPDVLRIQNELSTDRQTEKTVTINPLTKEDLEKHDMLTNKVLRTFKEIVDMPKPEEVENDQKNGESEEPEKSSDKED